MTPDPVRAYYAAFGEREWERLDRAEGIIELTVNTHFIETYLPASGRVLDLGGGPGRYAEWLASRGYQVSLADLSPEMLQMARGRLRSPLIDEIVEADARDLARWDAATFDAVLVLGPLYHLPDEADRARVAAEVWRVVRPGGTAFFALMPIFAFVRRVVSLLDESRQLTDTAFVQALLGAGQFMNSVPGRFTHGWGARPHEIAPWFELYGYETLALAASEGLAAWIEPAFVNLRTADPDAYDVAMGVLIDTATDPSLLGCAKHLLYVARRP